MSNFELMSDEVVLYSGEIRSKEYDEEMLLTLTSQRIVLERERGLIKKTKELILIISLSTVKWYHEAAQVKQRGNDVEIQTTDGNFTFVFSGIFEARKFIGKAIEAITDATLAKRVSDKTKKAIEMVDDTLEVDTRGAIKGVFSQGIKGIILNGIKKK